MAYMVTYKCDGKQVNTPATTANAALQAGDDAEARGAENVMVQKLGDDEKLRLAQFAIRYCSRSKGFNHT